MKKPPAFQFYADDFIAGTMELNNAEVGIYIRLLCSQWSRGSLPNDMERLARIAGLHNEPTTNQERTSNEAALRYVVSNKFEICEDGQLRNKRLEHVRAESIEWVEKSRRGGQNSGNQRVGNSEWGKMLAAKRKLERTNNEPINEPNNEAANEPTTNTPSPSPSPYISHTHTGAAGSAEIPCWETVRQYAERLLLPEWRAQLWFNDMEACGWIYRGQPVRKWEALLNNVKKYWEADGRPSAPKTLNKHKKPTTAELEAARTGIAGEEIVLKRL